jgi:hypothetical protein
MYIGLASTFLATEEFNQSFKKLFEICSTSYILVSSVTAGIFENDRTFEKFSKFLEFSVLLEISEISDI